MKLTRGILAAVMMLGGAWAQNPNIINNVQNQMTAVEQKQAADSNAALGIETTPANGQAAKPSPVAPAPSVKPASIPVAKPVTASKPASAASSKPASASAPKMVPVSSNKLEQVKVIHHADDVQIEMATREAITPTVDKLKSPERVVIEFPATAMATTQNRIAVGADGIKGVRIGMNGKTPPSTSVVVDLEHAVTYEISPGPSNKFLLTLHVQGASQIAMKNAKAQPPQQAPAKAVVASSAAAPKASPAATRKTSASVTGKAVPEIAKTAPAAMAVSTAKPATAKPVIVAKAQMLAQARKGVIAPAPKIAAGVKPEISKTPATAPKAAKATKAAKETITAAKEPIQPADTQSQKIAADAKLPPIGTIADAQKAPKPEEKKWAMNGKRDPFFSPIVQQATGSGCSTGKKCLEIGQINVRGIVKSQDGFIAVVTNSLNKAYFLHENDPVFNGFVLRITGDSVVFQETYEDKLGKPITREVTKRITTPAV
ncbi:MAG: AMIN domain-containing protein [Candidatus Sulfotelmatobacter sp.]